MSDPSENKGERWFRGFIGVAAIVGSLSALGGLYFIDVPAGNKEPLLLALGLVLGWGSSVISSEYGSTTTGRKVADSAIRGLERQNIAATETTPPADAVEAAQDTADAAQKKATTIASKRP